MRATGMQLSPIFGLFSDPRNEVTRLLYHKPRQAGTHRHARRRAKRSVERDRREVENQVIDLMGRKPIYIADGHHRYTMALQYQKEAAEQAGGTLPAIIRPISACSCWSACRMTGC